MKKLTLLFTLALLAVAQAWAQTTPPKVDGWYQISTAQDLADFATGVNSGTIAAEANARLTAHIDCAGLNNYPGIGNTSHPYGGRIEGQGYYIRNLTVNRPGVEGVGLIAVAKGGCQIDWLVIHETCSFSGGKYVGAFIGQINTVGNGLVTINKCANEAPVTASGANAAGFVGCVTAAVKVVITNCCNNAPINGGSDSAAFSGWFNNQGSTITNSFNLGVIITGRDDQNTLARGFAADNFTNTYDLANGDNIVPETKLEGFQPEWIADGTLCYKLNGDQSEIVWRQTIGIDTKRPMFSDSSLQVYAVGRMNCDGTEKPGVRGYSNAPGYEIRDAHHYVDGFCDNAHDGIVCGSRQQDYLTPKGDGFFEIGTAAELYWFAEYLEEVDRAAKARLVANIDYTAHHTGGRIGHSQAHSFLGVFDGQEHTIEIDLTDDSESVTTALFPYIEGATIRNLVVAGSISTSKKYAGGVVGNMMLGCTMENVVSEVTIHDNQTGDGTHGGLIATIGVTNLGSDVLRNYIRNCAFFGSFDTNREGCGGLIGWNSNADETHIEHCIVAPTSLRWGNGGAVMRVAAEPETISANVKNCYSTITAAQTNIENGDNHVHRFAGNITAADVRSGAAAYTASQAQGATWRQNLPADAHPYPFASHSAVFHGKHNDMPVASTVNANGNATYYLYNVETKSFFVGGMDWGTRASLAEDTRRQFRVTDNGNGEYSLADNLGSSWGNVFVADANGIWTDGNTGSANATTWTLTPIGGGCYRIGNTAFPGLWLGTDGRYKQPTHVYTWGEYDGEDLRLYMVEGGSTSWAFVTEADYNNYTNGVTVERYSNEPAELTTANKPTWENFRVPEALSTGTQYYIKNKNSERYIYEDDKTSQTTGDDWNQIALWTFSSTSRGNITSVGKKYNLNNRTNWRISGGQNDGYYFHVNQGNTYAYITNSKIGTTFFRDNNTSYWLLYSKAQRDTFVPYGDAWQTYHDNYWSKLRWNLVPTLAELQTSAATELSTNYGKTWTNCNTAPTVATLTETFTNHANTLAKVPAYVEAYNKLNHWSVPASLQQEADELKTRMITWDNLEQTITDINNFLTKYYEYCFLYGELQREYDYTKEDLMLGLKEQAGELLLTTVTEDNADTLTDNIRTCLQYLVKRDQLETAAQMASMPDALKAAVDGIIPVDATLANIPTLSTRMTALLEQCSKFALFRAQAFPTKDSVDVDYTFSIANPSAKRGPIGWGGGATFHYATDNVNHTRDNFFGLDWWLNANTAMKQEITGLPNGKYTLGYVWKASEGQSNRIYVYHNSQPVPDNLEMDDANRVSKFNGFGNSWREEVKVVNVTGNTLNLATSAWKEWANIDAFTLKRRIPSPAIPSAGLDAISAIYNRKGEDGNNGWRVNDGTLEGDGNWLTASAQYNTELVKQTVTNLPVGTYKVTVEWEVTNADFNFTANAVKLLDDGLTLETVNTKESGVKTSNGSTTLEITVTNGLLELLATINATTANQGSVKFRITAFRYYGCNELEPGMDLTYTRILNPGFELDATFGYRENPVGWYLPNGVDAENETEMDAMPIGTPGSTYFALGAGGNNLFNCYPTGHRIEQNIGPLPAGVYRLEASVTTDGENVVYLTERGGYNGADTVHRSEGKKSRQGNKHVMLKEYLTFIISNTSDVYIGAEGKNNAWYKVDDFKLTFLGGLELLNEPPNQIYKDALEAGKPFDGISSPNYNYAAQTGQTGQAERLAAINYLTSKYDDYLWDVASLEHPYHLTGECFRFDATCRTLDGTAGNERQIETGIRPDGEGTMWSGRKSAHYEGDLLLPFRGAYIINAQLLRTEASSATTITLDCHTKGEQGPTVDGKWEQRTAQLGTATQNDMTSMTITLNEKSYAAGFTLDYTGLNTTYLGDDGVQYYFGVFSTPITFQPTEDHPAICAHHGLFPAGSKLDRSQNSNGVLYVAYDDQEVVNLGTTDDKTNIVRGSERSEMVCQNLVLVDGHNYIAPIPFEANSISYTLSPANVATDGDKHFATLSLPFNIASAPDGCKLYKLDRTQELQRGNEVNVVEVEDPADEDLNNTPMLVTKAGTFTGSGLVQGISKDERAYEGMLVGVYQKTTPPAMSYVLQNHKTTNGVSETNSGLAFYRVDDETAVSKLNPFRCYIMALPTAEQRNLVKRVGIVFDFDDEQLAPESEEDAVQLPTGLYDLSGRKLERTVQRGIYIKNGKKMVVR